MRPIQSYPDSLFSRRADSEPNPDHQRSASFLHSLLAIAVFALLVLLVLTLATSAAAQSSTPAPAGTISDDQVNAVAKEMYCPVCENTPLDVCPTQACTEWRELIREMLAEGQTETEIKTYFVARFGDRVLAEPPRRGLNWLIYALPPVIMLLGVVLLLGAFRSWRQPLTNRASIPSAPVSPSPGDASPDEYVRRLEEELRKQ